MSLNFNTFSLSEKDTSRFWKGVSIGASNDCWMWNGAKNKQGYGRFTQKKIQRLSHRVAFTSVHGPIKSDTLICHRCDNPSCCNPGHLFAGSSSDNVQDSLRKGRQVKSHGLSHWKSKLDATKVLALRKCREEINMGLRPTSDFSALYKSYGITAGGAYSASKGLNWRHIKS